MLKGTPLTVKFKGQNPNFKSNPNGQSSKGQKRNQGANGKDQKSKIFLPFDFCFLLPQTFGILSNSDFGFDWTFEL
jgi:hypothetical protein